MLRFYFGCCLLLSVFCKIDGLSSSVTVGGYSQELIQVLRRRTQASNDPIMQCSEDRRLETMHEEEFNSERRLTIFGSDGRGVIPPSAESKPRHRHTGILRSKSGNCTASLVGFGFIVTAMSCVIDVRVGQWFPEVENATFELMDMNGESLVSSKLGSDAQFPVCYRFGDPSWDVIAIKLEDKIGQNFGYHSVINYRGNTPIINVRLLSYTQEEKFRGVMTEQECSVRAFKNGYIHHDCDTGKLDAPGSPLLWLPENSDTYSIVGMHVGGLNEVGEGDEYSYSASAYLNDHSNANAAVSGYNIWAISSNYTEQENGSKQPAPSSATEVPATTPPKEEKKNDSAISSYSTWLCLSIIVFMAELVL